MRARRAHEVAEIAVGMEAESRDGMCLCMGSPWMWFDLAAIGLELPLLVWGLLRCRPPPRPGIVEGALVAAISATMVGAAITLVSGSERSELGVAFMTIALAGAALVALVHVLDRLPDARREEPLAAARAIAGARGGRDGGAAERRPSADEDGDGDARKSAVRGGALLR